MRARARPDSTAAPRTWIGRRGRAPSPPGYRVGSCRTRVSSATTGRFSRGTHRHRLAELADERLHAFDDVVDILRAGRASERAPDGAHRPVERDAHRDQHVRRLDVAGGTGRAGRHADALQVEAEHDRLGLHVTEQQACRTRKPLNRMAGEPYVGHPLAQTVPEPIAQPRQPLGLCAHVARANLDRLAEPDDADTGQAEALCFERPARAEDRVVLDLRGDEMALALRQGEALHGEVVGLGPAGGEDDLLARDLQKSRDPLARQVHTLARLTPESVDARGVSVDVREIRKHLGEHLGMNGCRRVVIQVHSTAHRLALHFLRCYARPAMDLAKKKLGVLLSTGLEHPNLETAVGLSSAALDRGADLYLYLIDDGVRALEDPRIRALPERGAKLFVCAYGCQKRRIPLREADTVTYCGLVVLTDLINATDRFIALN